jgi:hypothetical protein
VSHTPLGRLLREITDLEPPVSIDPHAVRRLAGDRQRRRMTWVGSAAVVVSALVVAVSLVPDQAPERVSSPPVVKTVTWANLSWQVPAGWYISEPPQDHSRPMGVTAAGPYMSTTAPTGSVCRSPADWVRCSPELAYSPAPTDGVIAWIGVGQREPPHFMEDQDISKGAFQPAICHQWPRAQGFQVARLTGTEGDGWRLVVSGCIFGPTPQKYMDQLRAILDSITVSDLG